MKRLGICITLLVVTVCISAGSLWVLRSSNKQLYKLADEVRAAYENGGDTMSAVNELIEYWQGYYVRISYVANSDYLNSVSSEVFRLKFLLENNSDEFISELESLCGQTELMYQCQFPHLYSVF